MNNRLRRARQATGFSLVEVMVALVIGMLGVIIMMRVFAVAEGQKRSTTGSSDAQSNGAMAFYALQRDIRQGGYGFTAKNVLGCALVLPAAVSHTLDRLAPVLINPSELPAGDANTDTLLIAYGSSAGSPEGDTIISAPTAAGIMGVQTPSNFAVGHQVVAAPPEALAACTDPATALHLAAVSALGAPTITVPGSGASEGDVLFNLGASPKILAYAIRAGNLTVCDFLTSNCAADCTAADGSCSASWAPLASNIVSLRAEYGRASTTNSGVDNWDQTTPAAGCGWSRTPALRIAVVARNSQFEKDEVTGQSPTWDGSSANPIDLSGLENWKNYRYRLFESVIPIRNLSWMEKC